MTKLTPDEAFTIIGCRYDYGMKLVRTGHLDGCFYRLGRRVIFVKEKIEMWQERKLAATTASDN